MKDSELALAIIAIPERPNGTYSVVKPRFARGTRYSLRDQAFERADTQPFVQAVLAFCEAEETPVPTRGRTPMMLFTIPAKEEPKTPVCNRHTNCDEADADTMLGHGRQADHCHAALCECCEGH